MKIQDIVFFIILLLLLWKNNPRWLAVAGLTSIIWAIPLFASWTFFTAERLTWYAAAFFTLSSLLYLWKPRN